MIPALATHLEDIATLCRRYGVARLDVFGSAAEESRFKEASSDVDFLVEFNSPQEHMADRYFGLLAALEKLTERPVDLVSRSSLRNPYFIRRVEATKQPLYAA